VWQRVIPRAGRRPQSGRDQSSGARALGRCLLAAALTASAPAAGNNGLNFHQTLSPIFAPIGQKHLTLGLVRRLGREYEPAGDIEYRLPERVTYHKPELPFGAGTQARIEYVAVHAMLSRRW
jgi:hypothetical protein